MTDQEIIYLAYEYANGFSSGIMFSEEQLIEFVRALLDAPDASTAKSEPKSFYKDPNVESILERFRSAS